MRDEDVSGSLRLEGIVVDEHGGRVANASVHLQPGQKTAATDAQGAFAFDQLASRRYAIIARRDELYAGPVTVRVIESAEPAILRMRRGATMIVHVVADGAPAVGARLVLDRFITTTTNADGVATIHGLAPEHHEAWVLAEGWAPAVVRAFLAADPGGVIERFVTLRRGARIDGVVLGPDDRPVPNTFVTFSNVAYFAQVGATSRADGTWQVDALEAGTYRVFAHPNSYQQLPEMLLQCDGHTPQCGVVVRIDVGAQVSGCVVDKSGAKVPSARVEALHYHEASHRAVTDEKGEFRFWGLKAGEYYVNAHIASQASAEAHLSLQREQAAEVRLVLEDAGVTGVVVDERGEPVVEATVRANACSMYVPYRLETATDARGRFDLGALQLGEYDLYATWPGIRRTHDASPTARVRSGDPDVTIVLASPGSVTGRVLLDGAPMPYYGVSLTRENEGPGGHEVGVCDQGGRFTLPADPGTWQLTVVGPGTKHKMIKDVVIERGKVVDVGDVAMERGQRISGHVRDSTGAAVPGARVTIGHGMHLRRDKSRLRQWFECVYEAITDAEGAYLFDGIAQPVWLLDIVADMRVRLGTPELAPKPPPISAVHVARGASNIRELPPGDATVDLVLIGSGTIEGIVEGAQGRHRFVDVVAAGEPEGARSTSVDGAGGFRFEDVPAGDYVVSLRAQREAIATENVTITADQCTTVRLVMLSTSVRLTIKVPRGREEDLVIERTDGDPVVVLRGSTTGPVTRRRVSRTKAIGQEHVTFSEVEPGQYRISLDGTTWFPIVVDASNPPEQTITFPSSPGQRA